MISIDYKQYIRDRRFLGFRFIENEIDDTREWGWNGKHSILWRWVRAASPGASYSQTTWRFVDYGLKILNRYA